MNIKPKHTLNSIAMAVGCSVLVQTAGAATVFCESFEAPDVVANSFTDVGVGSVTFDETWVIAGGTTAYQVDSWDGFNRVSWTGNTLGTGNQTAASDGDQYFQLQDSLAAANTITSTFATVAGQSYTLSFDYSAIDTAAHSLSINYVVDGTVQNVNMNSIDGQIAWATETYTFTALTNLTTMSFAGESVGAGFYGASIDNIVVVPEPSTTALFGLGGLALLVRRKK